MIMELKEFIDHAFEKYEESPELIDFKEELLTNLQDRLKSLEATGLKRTEAIKEIRTEFAEINKTAHETRLDKKQQGFASQYMTVCNFIHRRRAHTYPSLV